jgi:hypothetical protein
MAMRVMRARGRLHGCNVNLRGWLRQPRDQTVTRVTGAEVLRTGVSVPLKSGFGTAPALHSGVGYTQLSREV